jgi:ATP-dependent DNA ligase
VAFDLLALGDRSLMAAPFDERRQALEDALRDASDPVHTAPTTDDAALAHQWFRQYEGAGLDGVIAKRPDLGYRPDERVMVKIKHERTADCVVAGLRHHKSGPVVGSLLLGLYDTRGRLQHVGVCAAFPMRRREQLIRELEPLHMPSIEGHPWADWVDEEAHTRDRMPGAPSRWTGTKNLSWVPLRPERVLEVAYDHMQGGRFRHTAQFRRWRPDREPEECTYEQLEEPVGYDLREVLRP